MRLHELEVNLVCLSSELFDSQCYIVGAHIPPQKKSAYIFSCSSTILIHSVYEYCMHKRDIILPAEK